MKFIRQGQYVKVIKPLPRNYDIKGQVAKVFVGGGQDVYDIEVRLLNGKRRRLEKSEVRVVKSPKIIPSVWRSPRSK